MADSLKADLWKAAKHQRTRPWLAVIAELPASVGAHALWGHSPLAAAGLTVASGLMTATTWWAGKGTSDQRRRHATLTTGAASGFLLLGTITNPVSPFMLSTWAIGGAVTAGGWNIRQILRTNPDNQHGQPAAIEQGILTKAIGQAKVQLRGTPKVEPNKVTAPIQLAPGEVTTDELGNRVKHIAAEFGVAPTAVRILPDPDRGDRATLVVVPQDMLKQPTDWPGPSSPGGSITEAIHIGLYEDGAPAVLWFPSGLGRNATHFLTAGMNGSGKSAGQSVAITEALTRCDVVVWAIDPSKGMQTFAPFLPYLDWVEMTLKGGEAMISALSDVITARANELGRNGFKNWTPDAFEQLGMPYIIVWIEEAAKFFREGTEMEGLVMEARSAGISVIVSLQRPSSTSMPTDVREQLGGALVFGVKGSTTADMALPDDVRDAGARPEAWENRRPGYAYLVAPGVDEDRYATPLRTYRIDDDAIAGVLAVTHRPTLDPVTTAAAGQAYADRTIYEPDVYAPDTDLTSTDTHTDDFGGPDMPGADDLEDAILASVERDIRAGEDEDDDTPDPVVDPTKEIPAPATTWTFGTATATTASSNDEITTEQAVAAVHALLDEFRKAGYDTLGPRDFKPYLGGDGYIGRSRAWLSPRLAELAEQGIHLADTDTPGVYRLLYPELQPA
ncbi:plasmid transfer protein TraB [Actinacidiphila acididurans]|uniref:Conjugal transfer protein TraB n=1 Tax=Actinacidiphila acididurans TaxID=2784346 RepID=A0ABS2U2Y0_9ACTN|nr:plasmid transfer protein TraB [Actinacidiphila acididurans]MBM9509959.1 conjugal transfer protein TraB [Actinacidiphila acididurans]